MSSDIVNSVGLKIKYPCHLTSSDWDCLWFDDSRQRYILMKDSVFYLWAPWFNGHSFPDPVKFFTLPGPGLGQSLSFLRSTAEDVTMVMYAQLSLDSQLFAAQLSPTKVLVSDLKMKRNWTVDIKTPMDNKILSKGLVWSDHGGNSQDLVIVTRRGLELYKISSARGQCKLSRTVSHRVTAFFYEPNHRFLLLASPPSSTSGGDMVNIFQFEMNGYFLNINNHDKEAPGSSVRFELLPPSRTPSFELGQGSLAKCVIKDGFESMWVVSLYGTVYCVCRMHLTAAAVVHRDPEKKVNHDVLVLYAISRASVVATHVCFLNCVVDKKPRLSVVDNLLLCHVAEMGQPRRTVLFDIALSITSAQRVYLAPTTSESTPAYVEYVDPLCAPPLSRFDCPAGGGVSPVPTPMVGGEIGGRTPKKDSWDALGGGGMGPSVGAGGSPSKGAEAASVPAAAAGTPARRRSNASLAQAASLYAQPGEDIPRGADRASTDVVTGVDADSSAAPGGTINVADDCDNRLRYIAPGWIWDKEKRCQWQIHLPVSDIAAAIEAVDGPRRMFRFLLNRGQLVGAPRPVPIINREDFLGVTREAKACLLTYLRGYVGLKSVSLGVVESLFGILVRPYMSEVQRSLSVPASASSSHPSSPAVGVQSDQERTFGAVGASASASPIGSGQRAPVTGSVDSSGSARAPGDVEPLVALQQCMGEIVELRGRFNSGPTSSDDSGGKLERRATNSPERLGLSNVAAARRCGDGALVVTQYDLIDSVWLPLLRRLKGDNKAAIDRLTAALCSHIGLLRGAGLAVHPALSLMLFYHLQSYGHYGEACRLLQFQFFPDASELAVAALELSAELSDSLASNSTTAGAGRSPLCVPTMVRTLQQAGVDMLWRLEERAVAVRWLLGRGEVAEAMNVCIKRKGCWRKGLAPSAIPGADFFMAAVTCVAAEHRAMLVARRVAVERKCRQEEDQAVEQRRQMEEQAAELAAMGVEAEATEVVATAAPTPAVVEFLVDPAELAAESKRVRLFHALYSFLKEWDYGLLTVNQGTGKSKLASVAKFPEYAFEQDERACRTLKKLFGF